jgi:hypothetical protein
MCHGRVMVMWTTDWCARLRLAFFHPSPVSYYEDVPYATLARESGANLYVEGCGADRVQLSEQELERKLDAIWCYRSQLVWLFGSRAARPQVEAHRLRGSCDWPAPEFARSTK